MKMPLVTILLFWMMSTAVLAQIGLTPDEQKKAESAFATANDLLEKQKPREALKYYNDVLSVLPKNPAVLFNAGMAAFEAEEFDLAVVFWKRLKDVDPKDWRARTKLIQAFHSLNRESDIVSERAELFELRKNGKIAELKEEEFYCREQFRIGDYKVMAFEHFELKGDRPLRYAFMVSKVDNSDEFKISLGSYDLTNAIWRETTNPKPKKGERLFHLDGYFKNGGHATYGMYFPEPTYSQTREKVVKILEGKSKPVSGSRPAR